MRVFYCEPTNDYERHLRRVRKDGDCAAGCHASVYLGVISAPPAPVSGMVDWPRYDPRWPRQCPHCGYAFAGADYWFVDHDRLYRRTDTGELLTLRKAPPGAVWNASWLAERERAPGDNSWIGPDGRSLHVVLPDGRQWCIDSRASNCTRSDDKTHKCWVRHGRPEDGTLHVDKNGDTCAAGAGSIDTGTWHGFLHNGELRQC